MTDRVQLLLQCLDLGLHLPQELLHALIAVDGAAGRSWWKNRKVLHFITEIFYIWASATEETYWKFFWVLKMCNELRSLNKANVASDHMRLYLPDSSSSLSLSLSFFPSFFSFCNVTTEGGRSEAFHCLVISFTARPHVVFFFHDWLSEDQDFFAAA